MNSPVPLFHNTNEAVAFGRATDEAGHTAILRELEQQRAEFRVTNKTTDEKFVIAFRIQFLSEARQAYERSRRFGVTTPAHTQEVAAA
jgi:hypothetical protein